MVKTFTDGKIEIIENAMLIASSKIKGNIIKVPSLRKKLLPQECALHIKDGIYEKDIVSFLDAKGNIHEGIVVRADYSSVIICPLEAKKYSLRQSKVLEVIDTALNPSCKDIYKSFISADFPISSAKFTVSFAGTKHPVICNDFLLDLKTRELNVNINTKFLGMGRNKYIPIKLAKGEYGLNYTYVADLHEFDIVKLSLKDCNITGEVVTDECGAFIAFENKRISLHNGFSVIGNSLFERSNISSIINRAC